MKKRIGIALEELLQLIKAVAVRKNCSISQLVEEYHITLTTKKSLINIIEELPKSNFPDDFNFKKEYYEANKKSKVFKFDIKARSSNYKMSFIKQHIT